MLYVDSTSALFLKICTVVRELVQASRTRCHYPMELEVTGTDFTSEWLYQFSVPLFFTGAAQQLIKNNLFYRCHCKNIGTS